MAASIPTANTVTFRRPYGSSYSVTIRRKHPDDSDQPPLFSDEQIDTIAQALADLRVDMRAEFQSMIDDAVGPLTEAVAVLQGQVSVLMNLIGSLVNNNTVKEASETKTKTVRRVRQIESKPR